MKLKQLLLSILALVSCGLFAQTTLNEGDIAITALDGTSTLGEFAFVTLIDLEAGTEIHFSDCQAQTTTLENVSSLRGTLLYTAPSAGLKAGSLVFCDVSMLTSEWSLVEGTFNLTSSGDKINAFQGFDGSRNVTTWLFALSSAGDAGTFPGGFTSELDFTVPGNQEGEYSGGRNGLKATLFSDILDVANWTTSNSGIAPIDQTDFNVGYYWDVAWTPSNPGGVGSTFDDDVIVDGTNATFSGNVTTNGNIFVKAGGTMDVGTNTVTADSLIIEADASGQGQVKGVVTGDVEFQSYISGSAGWFNVGLPVDGPLSDVKFTNGGVIRTLADGPLANANTYYYDETTDNAGEGTWTAAADQTSAANANGWSIYLGGGGAFGTLPMTISSYGNLDADGVVSMSITNTTAGWNFVNNPYPATLDWEDLLTRNSGEIGTTYFIYDDNTDGWRGYNTGAGSLPTTPPVSPVTQFISAGQAFFVEALSATTLDFDDADVDMNGSTNLYRQAPNPGVYLVVTTSTDAYDYTYMGLRNGAAMGYDLAIDARKKFNNPAITPNISTSMNGEDFMFNFVENTTGSISMPVNLEYGIDDELTVTADIRSIDASTSVMLEDKLSGDMIDLRQQNYTFRHLAANDPDRFVLHLSQSSVGIDETANANEIFAYVAGDMVNVNLESLADETTVQLFDMGGKMLINEEFAGGQIAELNLPNGSQGVYLLKVLSNGQLIHSQKIMK